MQKLEQLREKITSVDAAIIEKLAERLELVKQIGQLKAAVGVEVFDPDREAQLMAYYQELCGEYQLDPKFVQHLFAIIIAYSRSLQK